MDYKIRIAIEGFSALLFFSRIKPRLTSAIHIARQRRARQKSQVLQGFTEIWRYMRHRISWRLFTRKAIYEYRRHKAFGAVLRISE